MKRKDATKESRIRAVTLDIVYEKGLVGVKMSEVAKKAGVSPSNLYIYFANKEDLLNRVFLNILGLLSQEIIAHIQEDLPYKKKIFFIFKLLINSKLRRIKEMNFVHQYIQSPYFKETHHSQVDNSIEAVFKVFRWGRKAMILKDTVDLNILFAIMEGTTNMLVKFHTTGRLPLNDEVIRQSFTVVWDALRQ